MLFCITLFNIVNLLIFSYAVFYQDRTGWWFILCVGMSILFHGLTREYDGNPNGDRDKIPS
jgi:hypothetical protein